jgi:hypothetical protein
MQLTDASEKFRHKINKTDLNFMSMHSILLVAAGGNQQQPVPGIVVANGKRWILPGRQQQRAREGLRCRTRSTEAVPMQNTLVSSSAPLGTRLNLTSVSHLL